MDIRHATSEELAALWPKILSEHAHDLELLRIAEHEEKMNDQTKSWYASKTFWTAIVVAATPAVTAAFPPAGAWLAANADWVCTGLGAAFGALRLITSKSVGG